jgi:hypothetical protein
MPPALLLGLRRFLDAGPLQDSLAAFESAVGPLLASVARKLYPMSADDPHHATQLTFDQFATQLQSAQVELAAAEKACAADPRNEVLRQAQQESARKAKTRKTELQQARAKRVPVRWVRECRERLSRVMRDHLTAEGGADTFTLVKLIQAHIDAFVEHAACDERTAKAMLSNLLMALQARNARVLYSRPCVCSAVCVCVDSRLATGTCKGAFRGREFGKSASISRNRPCLVV